MSEMRHFPLFVDLAGRRVVVVGGGAVAERKVALLLRTTARIRVVAPVLTETLAAQAAGGLIEHVAGAYRTEHLSGARLVVAAASDRAVNLAAAAAAEAAGILVNVVDDPQPSTCLFPAIVDRSPLVVAIGTSGAAPALAQWVRERIEVTVDESFGRLAQLLERWRARIKGRIPDVEQRRRLYARLLHGPVARLIASHRPLQAEAALEAELSRPGATAGSVILVGAGPGDPGLLTLNAVRALAAADVVLYDRLVSAEVLELVRRDATRIEVGKQAGAHGTSQERIQELLVEHAREGRRVVRLKGGDPFVYGRGGEELEHLRAAGISYQVVPGLTAASAATAYAGIPLTHRDHVSSVRLLTAHCRASMARTDWSPRPDGRETLAVYMGVGTLPELQQSLLDHGHRGDTPIAFVENGTRPEQRVILGTLAEASALAMRHQLRSPSLLVVGHVAALAPSLHWFGAPAIATTGHVRREAPTPTHVAARTAAA